MIKRQMLLIFSVLVLLFGCTTSDEQATSKAASESTLTTEETEETDNKDEKKKATAPLEQADKDQQDKTVGEKNKEEKQVNKKEQNKQKQLSPLKVHYIDAGQGDATLFEFQDGDDAYTILYDAGDWKRNDVITYLQDNKVDYIDIAIISHPHADHIGQLGKIIDDIDVGEVWMGGNKADTNTFTTVMEAIIANDIDYDEPRAGDIFDIGPLTITILHPGQLTGGLNEDSLSIHIAYGEVSFLFTGDAYQAQEKQMVQQFGTKLEADVLQLGHHGSNTSSSQAFIEAVKPDYAVYSAGQDNSYGHPHQEVVDLITDKQITLYGTDQHGTILMTTDGKTIDIDTIKTSPATTKAKKKQEKNKKQNKEEQSADLTSKPSDCIDVNHASREALLNITHIGDVRVDDLIANRPYDTLDDLAKIKGIADARIADIKAEGKACIGGK